VNIKNLKRQESPDPPEVGELMWNDVQHLCESCGRWDFLRWNGDCWICERCRKIKPLEQELKW
jgi:hypothetical protein